jgi:hypothetical protein
MESRVCSISLSGTSAPSRRRERGAVRPFPVLLLLLTELESKERPLPNNAVVKWLQLSSRSFQAISHKMGHVTFARLWTDNHLGSKLCSRTLVLRQHLNKCICFLFLAVCKSRAEQRPFEGCLKARYSRRCATRTPCHLSPPIPAQRRASATALHDQFLHTGAMRMSPFPWHRHT